MINANNRFIAEDDTRGERGPMEQLTVDPVMFEPQKFQPMIKTNNHFIVEDANNHFIMEDGRNYRRPPENGPILFEQQNFQPAINANNRFIEGNSRNYERGRIQQYNQGAVAGLQVLNDKVIN